jgi:hypothetical protein
MSSAMPWNLRNGISGYQWRSRQTGPIGYQYYLVATPGPANFRYRVLKLLPEALELPTLNFQVLRRTIAAGAQKVGSVKAI